MAQQVERVLGKDEVTGSNPVSSSTKKSGTLVPLFLWKCKAYIEPVTEVRTWFCFSKTDEARRVKKQSGGLFLAGAGSNPVSSSKPRRRAHLVLFFRDSNFGRCSCACLNGQARRIYA